MTEMAINNAVTNHLTMFVMAELMTLAFAVWYARKKHGRKTIL